MKYIIIGRHSSGKQALAKELAAMGVKVGKIFRSVENLKSNIYSLSDVVYSHEDINSIFENQGYLFLKEHLNGSLPFYEGLSAYEYENNDVFILSPDQFNFVPEFSGDVCFVWLDASQSHRRIRHNSEKRKYNFTTQENIEQENMQDFIERIYINDVLYFNNEDTSRVAAVIYSLITHPDLYDIYKEKYN